MTIEEKLQMLLGRKDFNIAALEVQIETLRTEHEALKTKLAKLETKTKIKIVG